MSNEYVPDLAQLAPGQQAQSSQVNTRYENTVAGFDKLPSPASGKKGFSEPCPVGTPTDTDHAATKEYVDSQLATQVSDAQAAQAASEAAQEASETAAGNAQTSETNAAASEAASAASEAAAAAAAALFDFVYLKSGRKNLIINGDFRINQRVVSSGHTASGADEFTLDRWRILVSGQAIAWAGINTKVVTAPAGGISQVIEGLNIRTGTHVISWTGTATCTVDGVSKNSGDTFELTEGTNCTVTFSGGTVTDVQVEAGTYATYFEVRHFSEERALCQRYYEKSYNLDDAPGSLTQAGCLREQGTRNGNSSVNVGPRYAVVKREVPTVAIYSPSTGDLGKVFNGVDKTVSGIVDPGTSGFPALTISSGDATNSVLYHFTADAEILL